MKPIFVTIASTPFHEMATGLERSVFKFYPDIPFMTLLTRSGEEMNHKIYNTLIMLHRNYDRVIFINADTVMCNLCPLLFEDYEYALPPNNGGNPVDTIKEHIYLNNGLQVTTTPKVYEDYLNDSILEGKQDQDKSNFLFYSGKYKTMVLDKFDVSYGIVDWGHYADAQLINNEIYVNGKKAALIHFATRWHHDNKFNLDNFKNVEVKNKIKELIT